MESMKEQVKVLLEYALKKGATDIHLVLHNQKVSVRLRTSSGLVQLQQDVFDGRLLEYLKFISGMDLCSRWKPQSGQFQIHVKGSPVSCRFSLISNRDLVTGVLRLLRLEKHIPIPDLTSSRTVQAYLKELLNQEHGLICSVGPTGSGKTTTIHALLHEMARRGARKIVSLEDPIEIPDESYLQLEINEAQGFSYEKGIEELMRHDPDVIFIGECRSAYTAKMAVRAALTGHLVFTTLHSGTGKEAIHRLLEFGVDRQDLKSVLKALFAQRLFDKDLKGSRKECVYEIWNKKDIERYFEHGSGPAVCLEAAIENALEQGRILPKKGYTH